MLVQVRVINKSPDGCFFSVCLCRIQLFELCRGMLECGATLSICHTESVFIIIDKYMVGVVGGGGCRPSMAGDTLILAGSGSDGLVTGTQHHEKSSYSACVFAHPPPVHTSQRVRERVGHITAHLYDSLCQTWTIRPCVKKRARRGTLRSNLSSTRRFLPPILTSHKYITCAAVNIHREKHNCNVRMRNTHRYFTCYLK